MPDWYWWLIVDLGALGVLLFAWSSKRYEDNDRTMTGGILAFGLSGLGLFAWSVVMASIGGLVAVVQAVA